jgi:RNA polymerase sigma factor (sigma-70 family)
MSPSPETRPSLLLRLADRADQAAWNEFAQIYAPVIHRLARRRGLQHADADDLTQQVLAAVAKAIDRWQFDPERGSFRTWLHTIARNLIINALTRKAPDRAAGDTATLLHLNEQPAAEGPTSDQLRLELRREMFRWAANQIRQEFATSTWNAFWLTAVDERSISEACKQLNLSAGAIYAARSRVMKRLKEKVNEFDEMNTEN